MTTTRLAILALAAFGAAALSAWPAFAACPAGTVQVGEERVRESQYVIRVSPVCEPLDADAAMSQSMLALARRQKWAAADLKRLRDAFRDLPLKDAVEPNPAAVAQVWRNMHGRNEPFWALAAANGRGPGLHGAGQQSFEDCTVFALATAAGRPYGVVAALATNLIRAGEWRSAHEQSDPQAVIERFGPTGGEVILLAETLGRVSIIASAKFPATLRSGRPILIGVSIPGTVDLHEIVVSKEFQHDGAQWYEIVDSNQGPQRRLYLSAVELGSILHENGVSYRPERGRTVKRLK